MKYPKAIMSITELTKLGYSRTELLRAAHHHLAPRYIMTTSKKGKFLFDTAEWEKVRKFVLRRN